MNNLVILNKENYEILLDKILQKGSMNTERELNQMLYVNTLEIIKDMDQINLNNSEYYFFKIEENKSVVYRKSKHSKLAIIIISDRKAIKRNNLIEISRIYLQEIDKMYSSIAGDLILLKKNYMQLFQTKEFTTHAIEELTIKYIEELRKNKLYANFIYYNYNPSVISSISYKKSKIDSTSVILHTTNKENERVAEQKDTILHKSTIKEKELNIELEKKAHPPSEKKIFVKKFNNVKTEQIKKKNISKIFGANFFIEKYFLAKNTMIHYLFNNIFLETSMDIGDNYIYPINPENEHILLYLLDIYDKAQCLFSVSKNNSHEYLDIVNYIEINLNKSDTLLTKSKLVLIKFKFLFIFINLQIYEDKNIWSSLNHNSNFYREIENLFSIVHNESFI